MLQGTRDIRHRPRLAAAAVALAGLSLLAACGTSTTDKGSGTTGGSGGSTGSAPNQGSTVRSPGTTAAPLGNLPEATQTKLKAALDQTMTKYNVPGAIVGVWVPGKGKWVTSAGVADKSKNTPMTPEMIFPLRSVTKSYTVTLILMLADEGKLNLDDTLGKYVSGVTDGDKITLRQLANMSSGNADYVGEKFIKDFQVDPNRIFTLTDLNSYVLGAPAMFAPGAQYIYVNANTNLLGAVVEKVTGQQFKDVVESKIIQPLGLKNTQYQLDATKWPQPHAVGYQPEDGQLQPQSDNLSIYGPAGSIISNLDDERVWGEALATGKLLKPATQTERLQGHKLEKGPPYGQYALGIGETDGWWGHNGEGFGFTAAVFHDPASGATIVVSMNAAKVEPAGHPADEMFRQAKDVLKSS